MASARPYPPSAQRIAEARASGHLPRASLVATCTAVLSVLALGWLLGPRLMHELVSLLRNTLEALARGDSAAAQQQLAAHARVTVAIVAAALAAVAAIIAAACALAGGASFGRSRARARFPKLERDRTATVLFALGLSLATLLLLLGVASLTITELSSFAASWAQLVALLAVFCALIDVAFARARFFASLWMTRREQLDEQRAAFGAPELRALRLRLRREVTATAAHVPLAPTRSAPARPSESSPSSRPGPRDGAA